MCAPMRARSNGASTSWSRSPTRAPASRAISSAASSSRSFSGSTSPAPGKVPGAEAEEAEVEAPARAETGETVLVVDDQAMVRMLITKTLEELGYAALEAVDGPSGLKVLQSDHRVDLPVTDVGLPGSQRPPARRRGARTATRPEGAVHHGLCRQRRRQQRRARSWQGDPAQAVRHGPARWKTLIHA